METIATLVDFWFGQHHDDAAIAEQRASLWWGKDRQADDEIRERFENMVLAASVGELDAWRTSAEGRLALILLCDQLPRNIYRGTPAAFQGDPIARTLCLEGLEIEADRHLRLIQRVFFYLPLEHSENLAHQHHSVALFQRLLDEAPPTHKKLFNEYLDFAVRHQIIIERFGRFPHRNAILGRASTPEELEFLQRPDSGF